MVKTPVLVVLFVMAGVGSCVPISVSSECQQRINSCLAGCDSRPQRDTPEDLGGAGWGRDVRSPCERTCHSLCL